MKQIKSLHCRSDSAGFFLSHTDLSDIVKQYPEKLRKYTYFVN